MDSMPAHVLGTPRFNIPQFSLTSLGALDLWENLLPESSHTKGLQKLELNQALPMFVSRVVSAVCAMPTPCRLPRTPSLLKKVFGVEGDWCQQLQHHRLWPVTTAITKALGIKLDL